MINCDANEFLDHINHDDAVIDFREKKFFFAPIYWPERHVPQYVLYISQIPKNDEVALCNVAEITGDSHIDCVNKFIDMSLWDGKTFWEVEKEMKWTGWDWE